MGGMFIHTTRSGYKPCKGTRFSGLSDMGFQDLSVHPYGIDPVLLASSSLYNPDVDETSTILKAYDCNQTLPFGVPISSAVCANCLPLFFAVKVLKLVLQV